MNPKTITIPEEGWIYRGDRWSMRFNFSRDVSDYSFALQFKTSRYGAVILDADIDQTHRGDEEPYIVATIPGSDTAGVVANLLQADLQAALDETWLRFSIPVRGQITDVEDD